MSRRGCDVRRGNERVQRRGFSLLEAVVAIAILGMVAVGALGAVSSQMQGAVRARAMVRASAAAESRLATLSLLDRETLRHLPDSVARGQFAAPLDDFRWTTNVSEDRAEPSLFQVKVQVESRSASFTLEGRLYRPAPGVGNS